jgi:hypothetical protein
MRRLTMTATGDASALVDRVEASAQPIPRGTSNTPSEGEQPRGIGTRNSAHRFYPYLIAGGLYLVLSVIVWLHVWTGHPTSTTTCGCGDTAATLWFIAWPAYAIAHGLNPLFSTGIGYPTGVNLVFAPYGIILAPITWLFGPVAALNVGLTLSPVLSALAMFALVRRWVSWIPAAFVSGLFYGFSPFILSQLSVAHADFGMLAIPPLVILCLDELLIRQRRSSVKTGVVLGLLLTVQFLMGLEVFVLLLIEVAIGVVLLLVYVGRQNPQTLRQHARPAARGCLAALITALVLLAYPAWLLLAGPAHISQLVHPGLRLTSLRLHAKELLIPAPGVGEWQHIVGGYQGPILDAIFFSQYFGLGVFVVTAVGIIIWRRERLLWFFGILSLVTLFLGFASGPGLAALPYLKNAQPLHFVPFAFLTVGLLLGVIVDRTRTAVTMGRLDANKVTRNDSSGRRSRLRAWSGTAAGLTVAAVAIISPAAYLAQSTPMTVEPVVLPTWFRTVAPSVPDHPVVLALPAPFAVTASGLKWEAPNGTRYLYAKGWKQAALAWQGLGGQRTSIVGLGDLGTAFSHLQGENLGQTVITEVTFAYRNLPVVTSADFAAVHRALSEWGVTTVVLPDQPELPTYDQVASVTGMAALIAGATGARPVHVADAWVWSHVGLNRPITFPGAATYARCTGDLPSQGDAAANRAMSCILNSTGT